MPDSEHLGECQSIGTISDKFKETYFTAVSTDMSFSNFMLVSLSKTGHVEGVWYIEMTQTIRSLLWHL